MTYYDIIAMISGIIMIASLLFYLYLSLTVYSYLTRHLEKMRSQSLLVCVLSMLVLIASLSVASNGVALP